MVGSTKSVVCDVCGGSVLAVAKGKFSKLSLRKSQQEGAKLCSCSQPIGKSSASKVCHASPKASAKINVLNNVVVKRPASSEASQGKCKILRKALETPDVKSAAKFNFKKYMKPFSNNPGTSKQTEEFRPNVAEKSMFDTQKIMAMSTPKFKNALQDESKIIVLDSPSPRSSEKKKDVFLDLDLDLDADLNEAFGEGKQVWEFEALVNEACDKELGATPSAKQTEPVSELRTPPPATVPLHMPLLDDNVADASIDIRQASPVPLYAPVTSSVSSSSSKADEEEDCEIASSLTQKCANELDEYYHHVIARATECQAGRHYLAGLLEQLENIDAQFTTLQQTISSKTTQIAGGHSRVVMQLCELEVERRELSERRSRVLEGIAAQSKLLQQLREKYYR